LPVGPAGAFDLLLCPVPWLEVAPPLEVSLLLEGGAGLDTVAPVDGELETTDGVELELDDVEALDVEVTREEVLAEPGMLWLAGWVDAAIVELACVAG
jgi:hypothetical protein